LTEREQNATCPATVSVSPEQFRRDQYIGAEGWKDFRLAILSDFQMPTLEFKGKPFVVYSHHLSVPVPKKSLPGGKKASLDDNLIIHGDNLEALKALLPRYAGKVDVIYIDPPYNTGNEGWAYNDKVNSPLMREWLNKVVEGALAGGG
jgi:hypothetical protein